MLDLLKWFSSSSNQVTEGVVLGSWHTSLDRAGLLGSARVGTGQLVSVNDAFSKCFSPVCLCYRAILPFPLLGRKKREENENEKEDEEDGDQDADEDADEGTGKE